jgi:diphthamide biosynthesis enzyme Dph1/Dph2-like protein
MIHFGHACLSKVSRLPILFVLPKYSLAVAAFVAAFKDKFQDTTASMSLFYDVGYHHAIGKAKF